MRQPPEVSEISPQSHTDEGDAESPKGQPINERNEIESEQRAEFPSELGEVEVLPNVILMIETKQDGVDNKKLREEKETVGIRLSSDMTE